MGVEGELPNAKQIAHIRTKVLNYLDDNGNDVFDSRDVHRLQTDQAYVERFYMHMYDLPGIQEDNAANMAINTFKWRKEQKVHEITADDLKPVLKDLGELYCHGRDKDGKVLMVFAVKRHVKGTESMDEMKKFFIYYMERIDRENNGDQLTLVFDCAGCGLKNMDMELIQYMIQVFKDYYPWSLNYILVFEMPWVLNAAWKIIKGWLPAGAVKKIKFLTKGNIGEYVAENQRPAAWGGTDDWEYRWEDEEVTEDIRIPLGSTNGDFDDEIDPIEVNGSSDEAGGSKKKSVHFAEMRQSLSADSVVSLANGGAAPVPIPSSSSNHQSSTSTLGDIQMSSSPTSNMPILTLSPSDEIVFTQNAQGDLVAKVVIKNVALKHIAYKIKTTSPEKFRVRPSMSSLAPGASGNIEIQVHSSQLPQGSGVSQVMSILVKEKFLITAAIIRMEVSGTLSNSQLTEIMKGLRPDAQYRLRCTYSVKDVAKPQSMASAGIQDDGKLLKQVESLNRKVSQLTELQEATKASLASMKQFVILVLILLVVQFFFMYLWAHPSNTLKLFQENCLTTSDASPDSMADSLPLTPLGPKEL